MIQNSNKYSFLPTLLFNIQFKGKENRLCLDKREARSHTWKGTLSHLWKYILPPNMLMYKGGSALYSFSPP